MPNEKLQDIRKRLRRPWGDYPLTILIINPVNLRLSRFLLRTPVTPNHITILSFILMVSAAVFLSFTGRLSQTFGGLLLLFSYFLDCLDGDLARLKNMKSPLGAMLDPMLDRFGEFAIILGASINGWSRTQDIRWLCMGIVLAGMSQIYFYLVDAMLKKIPHSTQEKKRNVKPIMLKGTRVRLGAIEPFIWGQSVFAVLGVTHWGVLVFSVMFSIGSIGEFFRIIIESRRIENKNSECFGTHFRQTK